MLTEQQKKEVIEQLSETEQMARVILKLTVPASIPGPVTVFAIGLSAMKILKQTEAIANKIKNIEQRKEDAANKGVPKHDNPPSRPPRAEEGTVKNGEAPNSSYVLPLGLYEMETHLKRLCLEFKQRGYDRDVFLSLVTYFFNL